MKTYQFGDIQTTSVSDIKVGDIVKALNYAKIGKDGKPTLCTIKVASIKEVVHDIFYTGTCEVMQTQTTSNILTYNLYVVSDLQNTDLLQSTTINFFNKYGYAIYLQSSGYRDSVNGESVSLSGQIKLLEHRVNLYLKQDLKDNRVVPCFSGSHKDFIKYLQDKDLQDIAKYYNDLLKVNR